MSSGKRFMKRHTSSLKTSWHQSFK